MWNSLNFVSTVSTLANWAVVVSGVLALVFSQRESALKEIVASKRKEEIRRRWTARDEIFFLKNFP